MIESYQMLLNYFAAEGRGEVEINCNKFEDSLILKNIDNKSVLIKTKNATEPNQMKILFYPIKYNFLEKVLDSLSKEHNCDQLIS